MSKEYFVEPIPLISLRSNPLFNNNPRINWFIITNSNHPEEITSDSIICFNKPNADAICDMINESNNPKLEYESTQELKEILTCLRKETGSLDSEIVQRVIQEIYETKRTRRYTK